MTRVQFFLIDWEENPRLGPAHIHPETKRDEAILELEASYNGLYSMTVIDDKDIKDKRRRLILRPAACDKLDCTDSSHYWLEDWDLGRELHCIATNAPESPSAEPILNYF